MRKVYLILTLVAVAMVTALKSYSQITVTATVGTSPFTYGTLRAAILAINGGTHGGVITISVTASTVEVASSVLQASGTGAANYTSILIKPAPATTPTITGNITTALLQLVGADNVTIDGSNTVGGTTRDLTFSNTNTGGNAVVFWISSQNFSNGATNNVIKNCRLTGFSSGTTVAGIITGDNVTMGSPAAAPNSNNTIQNNFFTNFQNAIYLYGAGALDASWDIKENTMTTFGFRGMIVMNTNTSNISDNTISGVVASVASAFTLTGIQIGVTTSGINIFRNNISNINTTGPNSGCNGIGLIATSGTGNNIYNNFISNVWSTTGNLSFSGLTDNGYGIFVGQTGATASYNIYYNTVRMVTPQTSGLVCAAINVQSGITAGSLDVRNNIFGNEQAAGATILTAIYSNGASSGAFSAIDYNDYYATSGTLGYSGATPCPTIALIQTNFGGNLNSNTYAPTFLAVPPDLHLSQTVPANYTNLRTATPIAGVTTDIDKIVRNPVTPTRGAHELLTDTIMYTSLASTCATGDVTLNPVTIIAPAGVPTTGGLMPRVYFRKNAGPWFSNAGSLVSGTAVNGTWSFVISAAAMGGVVGGDVISYYVIAQDLLTVPLGPIVFATPGLGLVATDVNTVTTPPTTPNTYTINAVSLTGFTTTSSTCFNPSLGGSASFPYTASLGSPNQYTVTWSPAGPTPVTTFATLPASPLTVAVPPATPVGTYTGILTIKNSTTLCTQVYTLTLTVNAPPNPIGGTLFTCVGLSTILTNSTPGGTWSSGSPLIATIGATSGVVNGLSAGTSIMTYTLLSGCYDTAIVNVNTPPAPIGGPNTVCQTGTITLTNTIAGGVWGSLTPSVASIDAAGVLTGIAGGPATITYATLGCNSASKVVTVNPLPAVITGNLSLCQGFTSTLGNATAGGTWQSSNHAVDTVGLTTGIVIAVSPGVANVSYTLPTGCRRIVATTVNANPTPSTGASFVCQGLNTTLTNTTPGGTWISQFPGVASVTNVTGIVTGVTAGSASLISYIVTATGCYATKSVTVTAPPSAISGPNVFCANSTATLLNMTPGGTWTSLNTAVATVGPISPVQGAVTGASNAGGSTIISYTTLACNPVTHPVTLTISPSIISGSTNVCIGTTTALGNTVAGGTWSSSNPSGASVSPGGVVTGLTAGVTVTITYALSNGCYTVAPIVVDNPPAPISGPDSLCQLGTGTFSNVTPSGLWSSSNGAIATVIAATGDVTAVTPGVVNISYSLVSGCYSTKPFKVRNPLMASVTFTKDPDTAILCSGRPLGFKAHPINGGNPDSITYTWVKFGTTILDSGTADTFAYVPTHGDFITVRMYHEPSLCALPNPATYSEYINVIPSVSPSMTIATSTPVITYLGQVVTFTSTSTNTGTSPTYQWYQNGLPVPGATNTTFNTPVYGYTNFYCVVTGNPLCAFSNTGTSNTITILAKLVGVQSLGAMNELSMSPNPNTGNFILTGTSTEKELDLEVTNMLGQVVFRGKTIPQNGVINESIGLNNDIAAGTYILRVHSEATNDVFHFVVNK
jgi:uncharacterized protein YjdB